MICDEELLFLLLQASGHTLRFRIRLRRARTGLEDFGCCIPLRLSFTCCSLQQATTMASPTALLILTLLTLLGFTMSYPTRDEPRQSQRQPLLSTAQQAPDLSAFYSLFASTGGSSEVPSPDLETRFDDPTSSMQFTLLAPTNDVSVNEMFFNGNAHADMCRHSSLSRLLSSRL